MFYLKSALGEVYVEKNSTTLEKRGYGNGRALEALVGSFIFLYLLHLKYRSLSVTGLRSVCGAEREHECVFRSRVLVNLLFGCRVCERITILVSGKGGGTLRPNNTASS